MLSAKSYHPISCNFPSFISSPSTATHNPKTPSLSLPRTTAPTARLTSRPTTTLSLTPSSSSSPSGTRRGRGGLLLFCRDSVPGREAEGPVGEEGQVAVERRGDDGGGGNDWTTSLLLFGFWAGLMFYVFGLTPDQTPSRDMYFMQKLLNLKGDDGFRMNEVLVALWYIMGLWPLVYSMLLVPSGRSSRSKIPVWPFLVLSCFGGAYALIPYFVLWKPPPPAVGEDEISKWPLNFLESKITSGVLLVAGLGLITYACLASGDVWTEFYQYFRESKFIHITCLDFSLLSTFAPFWVYNDMAARKWVDRGFWLLPVALIPFVGPALYLLLRPPLSALPMSIPSAATEKD